MMLYIKRQTKGPVFDVNVAFNATVIQQFHVKMNPKDKDCMKKI
uniref:Uncharacterized protein n=1 Tax=Rhizophora mucronata TaxID=61149 RepID=A0A2P2J3Q0_RHIMU